MCQVSGCKMNGVAKWKDEQECKLTHSFLLPETFVDLGGDATC